MGLYWVKTNKLIKAIFPRYIWDIPNNEKKVYLTFDDGPTPEVTEWVLAQLKNYNAKATFFCIGNNIENHPEIFDKVTAGRHVIGNHTFNHLKGWNTIDANYIENALQCEQSILKRTDKSSRIFRPPYGKVKKSQADFLLKMGFKVVMWDILSADFDPNITPEKCLYNVVKNIRSGSVVIFHDSVKARKNLEYALPGTLAFLKANGFKCDVIA